MAAAISRDSAASCGRKKVKVKERGEWVRERERGEEGRRGVVRICLEGFKE